MKEKKIQNYVDKYKQMLLYDYDRIINMDCKPVMNIASPIYQMSIATMGAILFGAGLLAGLSLHGTADNAVAISPEAANQEDTSIDLPHIIAEICRASPNNPYRGWYENDNTDSVWWLGPDGLVCCDRQYMRRLTCYDLYLETNE